MKPITELMSLVRAQTAQAFAARFPQQDLVVAEIFEKGRDYKAHPPLPPTAVWDAVTRAPGQPVPVGRDARALVQLDHAAVSRLHMVMAFAGQGWKVMDRSSNGTWLDEERMPSQQAVPVGYGVTIRLGRAMVVRVFTPEGLHQFARSAAEAPAPAPPPPPTTAPPADPRASTWRFAAIPDSLLQPDQGEPPSSDELSLDFDHGGRGRGSAPPPPPPPPPPPRPGSKPAGKEDGIEFEFDLDFTDGKGGFA